MLDDGAVGELRRELSPPDPRGGVLTVCLSEITLLRRDDLDAGRRFAARLQSPGDACPLALAAPFLRWWVFRLDRHLPADLLDSLPPLLRSWPEAWRLEEQYASLLRGAGRTPEALDVLRHAVPAAPDGFPKANLYNDLLVWGRPGSPEGVAIQAAILRDSRIGIPLSFGLPLPAEERVRIARAHRDWRMEWGTMNGEGKEAAERGQVTLGLRYLDRAVALADSVARPHLLAISLMNRGRAFAKLGRLDAAERDLLRGIALGPASEDTYYLYECWHNLGHVYESTGRFREAARAMDQFAALTRNINPEEDDHWMSLYDAGTMRWRAGWHAAARAAFEAMVRAVDRHTRAPGHPVSGQSFAGEYYERQGDLPRALSHYRQGAIDSRGGIDPMSFAGLARVYDMLGRTDSAEAAARVHDAHPENWPATEVPLLPRMLANRGRFGEALPMVRAWADRQAQGGDVRAMVVSRLELADLLLRAGNAADALTESTRADSLARSLTLTDELIRAGEIRGQALMGMERLQEGQSELQRTAALARAHPTADYRLTTELALASALARSGAPDRALAAYDAAARAAEQVTAALDLDVERAGYRDRHLLPYDGAMRILLRRGGGAANLESLLRWSERRTGAALAMATKNSRSPPSAASIAQLQLRLEPREALLDYLIVDSAVAALVVTRDHAALVSLPIRVSGLQQLLDRVRRPLVATRGGRLDLARAPFDGDAAHVLYAALIAPLDSLLTGRDRLDVVPDGPLAYLPFEALAVDGSGSSGSEGHTGDGEYLIDRFQIVYYPSPAFLARPAGSPSRRLIPPAPLLGVETGVSGGLREIAAIREAWPAGLVTTLEERAATETAARAAAHGMSIVHFASHAVADGRDPLASYLRLGPDAANDGYLHANEIAAERLSARLVVLSGCETLVGPDYRGEGLMGLARAFLAGGAGAVLASQWPVGPGTAELMGAFYRGLASGEEPGAALRAAQLALRRDPRTAHPFYWAGFVLVNAN